MVIVLCVDSRGPTLHFILSGFIWNFVRQSGRKTEEKAITASLYQLSLVKTGGGMCWLSSIISLLFSIIFFFTVMR